MSEGDEDAGASTGKIYDRELALSRVGGNPAIADELLGLMLKDLPAQRHALLSAHHDGDHDELRRRAHRLRGSASCCGMPRLEGACQSLELAVRNQAWADVELLLAALIEQVEAALMLSKRRPEG